MNKRIHASLSLGSQIATPIINEVKRGRKKLFFTVLFAACALGCVDPIDVGSDCPPEVPEGCCPCPYPGSCPNGPPPLPPDCNSQRFGLTTSIHAEAANDG